MRRQLILMVVFPLLSANFCLAVCPSADLTGDCFVDFNDFAVLADLWPTTDFNDVAALANQWLTPTISDDMVYIPAGDFEMGDHFDEGRSNERPVHTVHVDGFFMGIFEVTNRQYCHFLNSGLSQGLIEIRDGVVYAPGDSYPYCHIYPDTSFSRIDFNDLTFTVLPGTEDHPMVSMLWYGAAAYCNWRSLRDGHESCYNLSTWECDFTRKGYRLPTEAEWEYAARGGLPGSRFPFGSTISHTQANYRSIWSDGVPTYPYDVSLTGGYHPDWRDGDDTHTAVVGSFMPNGYDLYDMTGNVWEYCNDWYGSDYYTSSPYDNPKGPSTGPYRIIRGGGWASKPPNTRLAMRNTAPWEPRKSAGFRIILDLE